MREEGGAEQVASAARTGRAGCPRVLEPPAPVGDREAHLGRLGGDAELVEQAFEAGVVAVVEDDEAGVDPVLAIAVVDPDRVGVAAEPVAGLVDDDLVLAVQQMGGNEARDSGSDDRDLHSRGVRREPGNG